MAYKFPKDIQSYLEKHPAFEEYLKSNRGEYRYVRCEFPQLMGWNTLTRPEWLPRSLKYPYLEKPYGIQARNQERLMRPHVNRVKFYRENEDSHKKLKQAEINMDEKPLEKKPWGEIRIGTWKKNNNAKVLVKIFDKSKPEWEMEDQLLSLEICKSQTIGHVNFVHYYGSMETKSLKYHIFEHLTRGNLLQVIRADMASAATTTTPNSNNTSPNGGGTDESKDDTTTTEAATTDTSGGTHANGNNSRKFSLTDDIIRKMFCQILFAVSHLHDKDMVHRNLKLENILVGEYFDIRIQDLQFLEKTTAQNRGDAQTISRTKYSTEYGPKKYRSPERMKQIGFNPLLDQVWGLGVILYAMFHRKFPFSFPEGEKDKIDRILERGTLYPRSSYPPGLLKLFESLFQPEEFRPRTWELFDFEWIQSDPNAATMKRQNAIGRFTHEKAKAILNEKARMLKIRKQLFKRFRLFRADMSRQPNYQQQEMTRTGKMLDAAESLIGHRPFSPNQLNYNFATLHDYEKLHKNEYWPSLFQFNPIKCKHLGIRRNYCDIKQDPKDMLGNLLRLQDKRVKQYPVPPNRDDPPKRPPLNLEYIEIDDYLAQK